MQSQNRFPAEGPLDHLARLYIEGSRDPSKMVPIAPNVEVPTSLLMEWDATSWWSEQRVREIMG